jgi:hypothetical protein
MTTLQSSPARGTWRGKRTAHNFRVPHNDAKCAECVVEQLLVHLAVLLKRIKPKGGSRGRESKLQWFGGPGRWETYQVADEEICTNVQRLLVARGLVHADGLAVQINGVENLRR